MKRFTWLYVFVCGVLLLASVSITSFLREIPVTLSVVSATPELVHLRANGPLLEAIAQDKSLRIDTVGSDVFLRPASIFSPGESVSMVFSSLENRFKDTTENMEVRVNIPEEMLYFVTEKGQLASYALQNERVLLHTPQDFIVNEYAVANNAVYILGMYKENLPENDWEVLSTQSLYRWDRGSDALEKLVAAEKWSMQKMSLSPDGNLLGLYRQRPGSYDPPVLWLYDTAAHAWKSHWNERFGAGGKVVFSPDNAWMLGIDIETQGYALSPIKEGPNSKPIGNFFANIGMSPSGRFLAFHAYAGDDVFTGISSVVVFNKQGESEEALRNTSTDMAIFDSVKDVLWFTDKDKEGITQIANYDLLTKKKEVVTAFSEDQDIVSLWRPRYSDRIGYGVKEQNITIDYDEAAGFQGLLDAFFTEENEPQYVLKEYDILTQEVLYIAEGMVLFP